MNILFITATFLPSPNGVAVSVYRTVTELAKRGHTVTILGPKSSVGHNGYQYIPFPTIGPFPCIDPAYPIAIPLLSSDAQTILKKTAWDIIHTHHPSAYGSFALSLKNSLHAPVVFTYHTQYELYFSHFLPIVPACVRSFWYRHSILNVCHESDAVIASAKWIQKKIVGEGIAPEKVSFVSTAGISDSFFSKMPKKKAREILGLPKTEPLFLSVSRISKSKNIGFILDAFAHWRETHGNGMLLLIGQGEGKDAFIAYAKEKKVSEWVRFVGVVSNDALYVWMRASDEFWFASATDVANIVLLEAEAAGLPVIATREKGSEEVVVHGQTGYVTPACVDDFVEAAALCFAHEKHLSQGASTFALPYSIEATTDDLLRLYRNVVKVKRSL